MGITEVGAKVYIYLIGEVNGKNGYLKYEAKIVSLTKRDTVVNIEMKNTAVRYINVKHKSFVNPQQKMLVTHWDFY